MSLNIIDYIVIVTYNPAILIPNQRHILFWRYLLYVPGSK